MDRPHPTHQPSSEWPPWAAAEGTIEQRTSTGTAQKTQAGTEILSKWPWDEAAQWSWLVLGRCTQAHHGFKSWELQESATGSNSADWTV